MGKLGFFFNQRACIGCRACQVACQDRNELPVGVALRKVTSYTAGTYPNAMAMHYAATCNHCANPACVSACPTGACQKLEDGTVIRDEEACIGCGACAMACPYGHPVIVEDLGKSVKCDACKAFRDHGQNPVCVDACLMRALEFGDLDELRAKHEAETLVDELPFLPEAATTEPSLVIAAKACALEGVYREWIL